MEQLIVVDENNNPIGYSTKEDANRRCLSYRCVQVFLFNANDELLICRRPDSKKRFAGQFAASAMGHVYKDETYEDAARRSMMEELGVDKILKKTASFVNDDEGSKVFQEVWRGAMSDEIIPDETEIAEYKYVNIDDLEQAMLVNPENFAKPFVLAVKAFVQAKTEGFPRDKVKEEAQAGLRDF